MSDSIIAVVPTTSDADSVQASLSPAGLDVTFIHSLEEALRLLSSGSPQVFYCDERYRNSWREPILGMLQSKAVSQVVLLSHRAREIPL